MGYCKAGIETGKSANGTEIWMPIQNAILAAFPQIKPDPTEVPPEGFKVNRGKKGGGKKA